MIQFIFTLISFFFFTAEKISFVGPNEWNFEGRIIFPSVPTGPAVLLLGGGIGNDLNWSVPGTLDYGGEKMQITITGEQHEDAPGLVDAFIKQGCVVMHYSTISKDDPKKDKFPYESSLVDPLIHMEIARAALAAFMKHPSVQNRPIVVVGFSMGAQRAVLLAKENSEIQALILLSGAQITATGTSDWGSNIHHAEAIEILNSWDTDHNGVLSAGEIPRSENFIFKDFDNDGMIRQWEISGELALRDRSNVTKGELPAYDKHKMPFGEPILDELQKPTLAVYGSLDEFQSCHALILAADKTNKEWLKLVIIPEVGHQLGPELDDLIGPISDEVCKLIATWVTDNPSLQDSFKKTD